MSTITERIAFDVGALSQYFDRLFSVAKDDESYDPYGPQLQYCPNLNAFIRPDMACNVYSLVLFWLPKLLRFHQTEGLPGLHSPKGKESELERYHGWYARNLHLNADSVSAHYEHLDGLRVVRNVLVHAGSHVEKNSKSYLAIVSIPGISIDGSLIQISEPFIWQSLDHAKEYLSAVAQADPRKPRGHP